MTRNRGRRPLSRVLTTLINSGTSALDPVSARSVMASNRFYMVASAVSLPWVFIIAFADAPHTFAPALTHLTMICVWVICVELNRRRFNLVASFLGLLVPILQFAYLSRIFSLKSGFGLLLLVVGALAFVMFPPRRWVMSAIVTLIATATLVRMYLSHIYTQPSVEMSERWYDWVSVGNVLMAVAVVSVLALFNNRYFVREHVRNDVLLAEAEIAARTDALTEVLNRRGVAPLLSDVVRKGEFALALADLDRFKRINDRLGHGAGDVVLSNVARTLTDSVGKRGTVARWGGEEFLVVLPGRSLAGAVAIMEAARQAMEDEYGTDTYMEPVTISVGVAHAPQYSSKEEVLRLADAKLYEAKASGRNLVVGTSLPTAARHSR